MTVDCIKRSIAEFERSLLTPDSRFDRYLRHDSKALTSQERSGMDGYLAKPLSGKDLFDAVEALFAQPATK